jgi:translation elongation factor aEF-1 beta
MVGIVAVIVKIFPDSPDANLEEIKKSAMKTLEEHGSQNISIEEDPIAFGLNALKIKFAWPEEKDTDLIENSLSAIEHVSSVKIEDYRRAFG